MPIRVFISGNSGNKEVSFAEKNKFFFIIDFSFDHIVFVLESKNSTWNLNLC